MRAATLRSAARWYLRRLRGGPSSLSARPELGLIGWLGLVAAPVLALLAVVAAAAGWLLVGLLALVAAGLALVPPFVLASRERARRERRGIVPLRVGARGTTPEQKLAFAVGAAFDQVRPKPHPAVDAPRATVVVACFNDAHLLGAALHSVARQTTTDFQCVVVDDGSTDESMDVAMLFADVDRRFEVVRHTRNRGLSAARNTGLAVARGTYVTFLDSDDFLFRESLEQRLLAVAEEPTCIGAYCWWRSVEEAAAYHPVHTGTTVPSRASVHLLTIGYEVPFIASAPLVRTDVLRATGGFDETLTTAEDADMWARLLRGGVWLAYARYCGVAYRQRSGSMVRRSPLDHLGVVTRVAERLDAPWEAWPGAPAPVLEPLAVALRRKALLARHLNFLALHLALHGAEGVEQRHLPHDELRSLPEFAGLARKECARALRRIGQADEQAADSLTAQLLALAPPPTRTIALPPTAGVPGTLDPSRAAAMTAAMKVVDVATLGDTAPVFVLAPQSRYHVAEVGPLYEALQRRGVPAAVYLPPEAPASVMKELASYVDRVYRGDPEGLMGRPLTGAFVLNDWAPSTQALAAAVRAAGGTSFAKVEGVQDFTDADTGRIRRPYQHSDVVLGQGRNDVDALPGQDVRVIGSSRLERIWAEPPVSALESRVLINFNFTYGVLTDKQDEWIWAAVNGARGVGVDYEISLHPAQKNVPKDQAVQGHVSVDPFSHALRRAGVLVSRFSTVLYEAMALGVPVLYLNSHGEKVPTFQDPGGAFVKVTGTEVGEGLAEALSWRGDYRARAAEFFRRQVDIDPQRPSEERAADVITQVLGG